ncbi:MAG: endonuclease [Candidatus Omnitrophica bacterium CG1_02_49_16]|nr:MAG: endonuclease [Candidatus Omnitrophica bacterium CG1_02_49_16]
MQKNLLALFRILKKSYGSQHWWPANTPFEVAVGAILTQNTSWANVERAIDLLKKAKLLSPKKMFRAPPRILLRCLRPAGFFNIKAKRLKNFLDFLFVEYGGSLKRLFAQPTANLRQKLLNVNGIGPETADSIILYAAEKPIFVVDAYTKRIFSRIGSIRETDSYDQVQGYFMRSLPGKTALFNEFHALIVEHAKRFCRVKPICDPCPLRLHCRFAKHLSTKEQVISTTRLLFGGEEKSRLA